MVMMNDSEQEGRKRYIEEISFQSHWAVTVGGTLVTGVQTNRNSTLCMKIANMLEGAQRAMLEVVVDKMSRGGRQPERVALLPAKGKNRRPMKASGGSEYGREKILWKVGYWPVLIQFCTGEGTDNTRKGLLWGRILVRVLIGGGVPRDVEEHVVVLLLQTIA